MHIYPEHVFRATGVPNRSRQPRISLVKYKFIFYLAPSSGSSSRCLSSLICSASRRPITIVEFKLIARQVVASVVIREARLEFVAESITRVYFAQHVASTRNIVFCYETTVGHKRGNTLNGGFQLAMQQCSETSWTRVSPVLPDLNPCQ